MPVTLAGDLGAVLSQVQEDGKERVIAFASRSLSRQEQNYSLTRQERLGTSHF